MEEECLILVTLIAICAKRLRFKRHRRTRWSRQWLLKRHKFSHVNLIRELQHEPSDWRNYLRMDTETYDKLLDLVTPHIQKKDCVMRASISTHERLSATLRFLATGRSYKDLEFTTIISKQALSQIIPETCIAIYNVLKTEYLKEVLPELGKYGILVEVKACGLSLPLCDGESLCSVIRRVGRNRLPAGQDVAGVVRAVGSDVTSIRVGDQVTGIIPVDYEQSGCAEQVVLQEFDLAIKPNCVSFVDAAGCVGECVRAYLALHYLARLVSGDTVLVINGASSFGSVCIQLAYHWGAKVIATCISSDEKLYLQTLGQKIVHVVDMEEKSNLRAACMKETSNLGVNIVIDQRTPNCSQGFKNIGDMDSNLSKDEDPFLPNNHDIISCLAVGSHWITTNANLQLDPPHSRQLSMRCASIGFLFDQAWLLGSTQQGKYQHILMDVVEKLSTHTIRPNIHHTVGADGLFDAWQELSEVTVGKVVFTS